MTLMATEIRTEYAIKGTAARHGKYHVTIETYPGHEADREWMERLVEERREAQKFAGRTPDAELVSRTVTVGEWSSESEPAEPASATPTEIAKQVEASADLLRLCLIAPPEDWDCDYAAVTISLKEAVESLTGTCNVIVDFADGCDTPEWTNDVREQAAETADRLLSAGWAAETLADEVEHAQSAQIGASA
ncbi:hypothetical protein ABGB18_11130 [Nonomuraea sp. B12E4]|uniref:hypothetical protein n=1 Tax=Nonomuraea sp. B12E4 TaxID=3153564 RepID=UPI00325F7A52